MKCTSKAATNYNLMAPKNLELTKFSTMAIVMKT